MSTYDDLWKANVRRAQAGALIGVGLASFAILGGVAIDKFVGDRANERESVRIQKSHRPLQHLRINTKQSNDPCAPK